MATDISFVLSGGTGNTDISQSLGSGPSITPIGNDMNNLFEDINGIELNAGFADYKCFYIFNDSSDDFASLNIWIDSQLSNPPECALGINTQNEIQEVSFVNCSSGGTFSLNLDGHVTGNINYVVDPAVLRVSIQSALNTLPNAKHAVVTVISPVIFRVEWLSEESNKKYPLLTLSNNALIPNDPLLSVGISVAEAQLGSPINSIAPSIGDSGTVPFGITFSVPLQDSPLFIGYLKSSEGFPVWITRTIFSGGNANALDGLTIKLISDRVPA